MSRYLLFLFLFCAVSINADDRLALRITADSEPLATVGGCVNALSGEFFMVENDIRSQRVGGLEYSRVYDTGSTNPNVRGYGWGNNYPGIFGYLETKKKKSANIAVAGNYEYDLFPFNVLEKDKTLLTGTAYEPFFDLGYTNSFEALLQGEPSFSRSEVICHDYGKKKKEPWWEVKLPNGTVRTYEKIKDGQKYTNARLYRFRITKEELPSGLIKHFSYLPNSNALKKVWMTNSQGSRVLDSLSFEYSSDKESVFRSIVSSSGEKISYCLKPVCIDDTFPGTVVYHLASSYGKHLQNTSYQKCLFHRGNGYHFKTYLAKKPGNRGISVRYYNDLKKDKGNYSRVSALELIDSRKRFLEVFNFNYFSGKKKRTEVVDYQGNKTTYFPDKKNRLQKIIQGDYRVFKYFWDDRGRLLNKGVQTLSGRSVKCTFFEYDEQGNPAKRILAGNITGLVPDTFQLDDGGRLLSKTDQAVYLFEFSKDGMNLKTKEILPNGAHIELRYKPGTNLLTSKLTRAEGRIQLREFNTYDENTILIRTIEDDGDHQNPECLDGVSYRLIKEIEPELNEAAHGYTLPKVITEYYHDVATGEQVLLKRTELEYTKGDKVSVRRIYDANGQFSHSSSYEYNAHGLVTQEVNGLGETTIYRYDANDNLILKEVVGSGTRERYTYDYANCLLEEIVECDDGVVLATKHTYDRLGNRLSTVDPYGAKTTYEYDSYYREVKQSDPFGHTTCTDYDLLDNPVKITDKEGNTTVKKVNINGDPLEIHYPDGTHERLEYYIDGNLRKKWEIDGSIVIYQYDYQNRVTCETRYSSNGQILKEERFKYKGKNLVSHIDSLGIETQYSYDCAGRLIAKQCGEIVETYAYDTLGRQIKKMIGNSVEVMQYDVLDRLDDELCEDRQGNVYRKKAYSYDVNGNKCAVRTYYDYPKYAESKTIYNGLNLPVLEIDPEGNETCYVYEHGDCFKETVIDPLGQETHRVFDALKRVISKEVRYMGKVYAKEKYEYSPNGNKVRQINEVRKDGISCDPYVLEWSYDPMGRVTEEVEQGKKLTRTTYSAGRKDSVLKPDDVCLNHAYDDLGRLISLRSSDGTIYYEYAYDTEGNLLLSRDLVNKTELRREYDIHGRVEKETLPNGKTTNFKYDALGRLLCMAFPDGSKVQYEYNPSDLVSVSRKGQTHTYAYDQAGNIIKERCFNGQEVAYKWDLNFRVTSIHSPHFNQILSYDAAGNLIGAVVNGKGRQFTYNPLYQLVSEQGQFNNSYAYDSVNNRLSKDNRQYHHNDLQQLLSDGESEYAYDPNGNRIRKENVEYRYDALNRLTSANSIRYTYDSFGRLLSRNDEAFLYCNDFELGTENKLRIIGKGSIGFERKGQLYSLVRDYRGSIVSVVDNNGQLVAMYHYTAFGESVQEGDFELPWQYSAQRMDPETRLMHYLKRIYDPHVGRWLTPDPAGFVDGPNLYAYVHNNPLRYVDPDGLTAWEFAKGYTTNFLPSFAKTATITTGIGAACAVSPVVGTACAVGLGAYCGYKAVSSCWGGICSLGSTVKNDGFSAGVKQIKKGAAEKYTAFMNLADYDKGAFLGDYTGMFAGGVFGWKFVRGGQSTLSVTSEAQAARIPSLQKSCLAEAPKSPLPEGHMWTRASPFRNKTAQELHEMFSQKGYTWNPQDPMKVMSGKGNYINPKNLRQYHIDPKNVGRYREPNHVDVSRASGYTGSLGKKRFGYYDD